MYWIIALKFEVDLLILENILSVYRPPGSSSKQFLEQLCNVIKSWDNKNIIFGGDFNIDALKIFKNNSSSPFYNELTSREFIICDDKKLAQIWIT